MKEGEGGKCHRRGEVSLCCQMSMDNKCLQREKHPSQCFAIKKEKDFIFHKHLIYRIFIHTLLTVWGSATRSWLLLLPEGKWAFSILSQRNCKRVAGLHPVLLLPQFHTTST